MKINEYDTIYINEDFCDVPAKTKGVVLMIFHREGDQEMHAEIEFIDIECKDLSYTVPFKIIKLCHED